MQQVMIGRYRAVFAIPHLVNQIARASWARLAPPAPRDSVYAVDATLQELLFVIGPLAVAATIALAVVIVAGAARPDLPPRAATS